MKKNSIRRILTLLISFILVFEEMSPLSYVMAAGEDYGIEESVSENTVIQDEPSGYKINIYKESASGNAVFEKTVEYNAEETDFIEFEQLDGYITPYGYDISDISYLDEDVIYYRQQYSLLMTTDARNTYVDETALSVSVNEAAYDRLNTYRWGETPYIVIEAAENKNLTAVKVNDFDIEVYSNSEEPSYVKKLIINPIDDEEEEDPSVRYAFFEMPMDDVIIYVDTEEVINDEEISEDEVVSDEEDIKEEDIPEEETPSEETTEETDTEEEVIEDESDSEEEVTKETVPLEEEVYDADYVVSDKDITVDEFLGANTSAKDTVSDNTTEHYIIEEENKTVINKTVVIGEKVKLFVDDSWESKDKKIATIKADKNKGAVVKGKKVGETTIVRGGTLYTEYKIKVVDKSALPKETDGYVYGNEVTVKKGKSIVISPADKVYIKDENVLKYVKKGNFFKPLKTGSTIVKISGTHNRTYNITVESPSIVKRDQKPTLGVGQTMTVSENLLYTTLPVTYQVQKPDIISVDIWGNIYGLKQGQSKLYAIVNGKKYTFTIKVLKCPNDGCSINVDTIYLLPGKNFKTKVSFVEGKKNVKFSSADSSIATVDEKGKIVAVKDGFTVITADIEGGPSYQIKVYVEGEKENVTANLPESITINAGEYKALSTGLNQAVIWSSAKADVATVNEFGVVYGVKPGKTTVKVKVGKKSYKVKVEVKGYGQERQYEETWDAKTELIQAADKERPWIYRYYDISGQWKLVYMWNIEYNLNGGKITNTVDRYTEGDAVDIDNPYRENFVFLGWVEKDGDTPVTNYSFNNGKGHKTLTAVWQAGGFNIYYDLQGGKDSRKNPDAYLYTNDNILLNNPTKTGYIFDGWEEHSVADGKITEEVLSPADTDRLIKKGSSGDKGFVAKWHPISYEIAYEPNGGYLDKAAAAETAGYSSIKNNIYNAETVSEEAMNTDGGSFEDAMRAADKMDNSLAVYDNSFALSKNEYARSGYSFYGWTESVPTTDISKTQYGDKEVIDKNLSSKDGDQVDMYAVWNIRTYQITYELNGGSLSRLNPTVYNYENDSFTLVNPQKEGYDFAGWTGSNGITPQKDLVIPHNSTGNKSYTANWTPAVYTLSFDLDGGSYKGLGNPETYNIESYPITLRNPVKDGYAFAGWTGTDVTVETNPLVIPTGSIGNRKYTAHYLANGYPITYDLNGGSIEFNNPNAYTYESDTITLVNPVRSGYKFTGWTGSNGDVPDKSCQIPHNSKGEKNYKANWEPVNYAITYDLKGGDFVSDNPVSYNIESEPIVLNDAAKEGYTFAGWTGMDVTVPMKNLMIATGSIGDRKYTANYTPVTYSITYHLNGGSIEFHNPTTYTHESDTFTLVNPTRTGYIFAGWTGSNGETPDTSCKVLHNSLGNKTYEANWTPITYNISYDLNGGSLGDGISNELTYNIESEAITLNNPTKTGYTFAGWTGTDTGIPTLSLTIPTGSYGDRSYIANFTTDKYQITYDLNDGVIEFHNPTTYSFESDDFTLVNPEKTGYEFLGWTGSNGTTPEPTTKVLHNSIGDKHFIANWIAISYSITYDLSEGHLPAGKSNPADYTIEDATITLENPEKDGYTFAGWTDGVSYLPNPETKIVSGSTGNRSFKAQFTSNNYPITWNLNGGSMEYPNPSTYNYTSDPIVAMNPERSGYDFMGWTGSNGTEPEFILIISSNSIGAKQYDANWEAINYSITYDLQGGNLPDGITNPSNYTVETPDFVINDPSKEGYDFLGWTGGDYTTPASPVAVENGTTGNIFFYANYAEKSYNITYVLNQGHMVYNNPAKYSYETTDFVLMDPARDGYVFAGWTGSNGDIPQKNVTVSRHSTGDKTFEAHWTPVEYTLTYNLNGGTIPIGDENPDFYNIESAEILLNNPEKEGYTFIGWSGPNADIPTTELFIPSGSMGDRFYIANYAENSYNITYNLNGGSLEYDNPSSYKYEGVTIQLMNPTKEGYDFAGWIGSNGTTPQITATIPMHSTGDKAFEATWTPTVYELNYNLVGGTLENSNPANYTIESSEITLNEPEKEGYTFIGWTGEGIDEAVRPLIIHTGSVGNRLYTANYTENSYGIVYKLNGGTLEYENPSSYKYETANFVLMNPTKEGYDFAGWVGSNGITPQKKVTVTVHSTGNKEYEAIWTPKVYNLSYNLVGGTLENENPETYTIESENIVLNNPSKTGYDFIGWTGTEAESPEDPLVITTGSTENRSYVANYTVKEFSLSYDLNGGTTGSPNPVKYNYESDTFTLINPVKTGYTFLGWTGTGLGEATLTVTIPHNSQGDKNYSAVFVKNEYNIAFNGNGGTVPNSATGIMSTQKVYYDTAFDLDTNEYVYDGYSFLGWALLPNSTYPAYTDGQHITDNLSSAKNDTITLYAIWSINSYNVTAVLDEGSDSVVNLGSYNYNELVNLVGIAKNGYKVVGFTGEFAGNDSSLSFLMPSHDVELDLITTPASYDIVLDPNGGSCSIKTVKRQYLSKYGTLPVATKPGSDFVGWSNDITAMPITVVDEDTIFNDTEKLVLTAIYNPKENSQYRVSHYIQLTDGDPNMYDDDNYQIYQSKVFEVSQGSTVSPATLSLDGYDSPAIQSVLVNVDDSTHIKYFYKRKSYKVNVIAGDEGIASVSPSDYYTYGSELSITVSVKAGYNFSKWTGSDVLSEKSGLITYTFEVPDHDTTFTAHTTTCVSFEAEGGSVTPPTKYVNMGEKYGILPLASKTGYSFTGWFTEESGGEQVTADTVVTNSEPHTLYAHFTGLPTYYRVRYWKLKLTGVASAENEDNYELYQTDNIDATTGSEVCPETIDITGFTKPNHKTAIVKSNGATTVDYYYVRNTYTVSLTGSIPAGVDDVRGRGNYRVGETVNLVAIVDNNYNFVRWDTNLTNAQLDYTNPALSFTMPAENVTVTPVVETGKYTVVFNNNVNGTTANQEMIRGNLAALRTNTFTRTGYDFIGWSTTADSVDAVYTDKQKVADLAEIGESITLYAVWSPKTYTMVFHVPQANGSIVDTNMSVTYGKALGTLPKGADDLAHDRIFTGWKDSVTGAEITSATIYTSSIHDADAVYTNLADVKGITYHYIQKLGSDPSNTASGYALADITTINGATGASVTVNPNVYEGFYAPENIETVVIPASGHLTVNYYYKRKSFHASFVTNEGAVLTHDGTGDYFYEEEVTAEADVLEHYEFVGFMGEINILSESASFKMPASDITLTATAAPEKYDVVIVKDDGTANVKINGVITQKERFTYGEEVTIQAFPAEGYQFKKWMSIGGQQSEEDSITFTMPAHSVTYISTTISNPFYLKVTALENIHNVGIYDTALSESMITAGSYVYVTAVPETYYKFKGWSGNLTSMQEVFTFEMPSNDVDIYCSAQPIVYEIHYDQNKTYPYQNIGTFYSQASDPKKHKMYNTYTRSEYTDTDANSTQITNRPMTAFAARNLDKNTYTRPGYTFKGWSKNPQGIVNFSDEEEVDLLTTEDSSIVDLYAVWEPVTYNIRYNPYEADYETTTSHINNPAAMTDQTVTYDHEFTLTPNRFTRTGYNFAGWGTDTSGTSHKSSDSNYPNVNLTSLYPDNANERRNLTNQENAVINLYAMWEAKPVSYRIETYVKNLQGTDYNLQDTEIIPASTSTHKADEVLSITAPSITGFTVEPAYATVTHQLKADGTTVYKFYYSRNTYTLTVKNGKATNNLSDKVSASIDDNTTMTKTLQYGEDCVIKANPAVGYSFNEWTGTTDILPATNSAVQSMVMPAKDVTLTAVTKPNQDTVYTVYYMGENANDSNSSQMETIQYTGTTDSVVEAPTSSYTGFNDVTPQNLTITGDGRASITYTHTRLRHEIEVARSTTNDHNERVTVGIDGTATTKTLKYGQTFTVTSSVESGYTFDGWTGETTLIPANRKTIATHTLTMPNKDVTLTANAHPNTNTKYTVVYKGENANDSAYSQIESVEYTGTTDSIVEAPVKTYTGFNTASAKNITITGNGSASTTYSYTRKTYTLTVAKATANSHNERVTATLDGGSTVMSKTLKYGQSFSIGTSVAAGYTFDGWTGDTTLIPSNKKTITSQILAMPNKNTTLTANASPNTNTKYTVYYKGENANDTLYSQIESVEYTGTTDTTVTATVKSYTGFTSPSSKSITITGDGAANTTYSYTRKTYALTVGKSTNNSHNERVTVTLDGGSTLSKTLKYGQSFTIATSVATGYTFSGWTGDTTLIPDSKKTVTSQTLSMPDKATTLTSNATANTNTAYKIQYDGQNIDNNNYTTIETVTAYGTTDATVTITPKAHTGFSTPANTTLTITGDGNAKKIIQKTRLTYTVSIAAGTYIKSVTNVNGTYRYGKSLSITATPSDTVTTYSAEFYVDDGASAWTYSPASGASSPAVGNTRTRYRRYYKTPTTTSYKFSKWSDNNTSQTRTISVTGTISLTATGAVNASSTGANVASGRAAAAIQTQTYKQTAAAYYSGGYAAYTNYSACANFQFVSKSSLASTYAVQGSYDIRSENTEQRWTGANSSNDAWYYCKRVGKTVYLRRDEYYSKTDNCTLKLWNCTSASARSDSNKIGEFSCAKKTYLNISFTLPSNWYTDVPAYQGVYHAATYGWQ